MTAAGTAYMGEDSCSKCHGGETRSELQANIDAWQTEATAAAATAGAAIDAANARRSAAALADPTSDAYILVGRATWNYKSSAQTRSTGAHNPEYIVAGLKKAEQMAKSVGGSFSAVFGSNSVAPGGTGFITGKVMNGDGSGAAGASLVLYADGSATTATTTADGQGAFAFIITPGTATTYKVVWQRSGNAGSNLASANIGVSIAKTASKTTVAASAKTVTFHKSVKLTGKVTPAMAGKTVKIQCRRTTGGAWKSLATVTLSATSQYSKTYKPTAKGAWYFRTAFAGTATVASSTSATVKVTVK